MAVVRACHSRPICQPNVTADQIVSARSVRAPLRGEGCQAGPACAGKWGLPRIGWAGLREIMCSIGGAVMRGHIYVQAARGEMKPPVSASTDYPNPRQSVHQVNGACEDPAAAPDVGRLEFSLHE